ncbi:MAG TPA: hypothetical protein VK783_03045 [Bacteroidia bacterium]|jgi:hypothetical protein|nr:hypothetical protein [Bacteroidia bacterium]
MDYNRGAMRRNNQSKKLADTLKHTPLIFDVAEPFSFFSEQGWKIKENISILDEGDRIGRSMPILFPWSFLIKILPPIRNLGNRTYGCVMFCKV